MPGGLNIIVEVIFVPIVVFCIIGFVIFKRKRKLERRRQIEQRNPFTKPWDPTAASTNLPPPQPVYGGFRAEATDFPPQYGYSQQGNYEAGKPWEQSVVNVQPYTPAQIGGYQQPYHQQSQE
ncbi:uncharacterized protein LY89DRAFT_7451 [Mollisia scopiformis]|uniref:Uncharacterized protein n=1 Tax=Mollisia scopiformis TaxID=149040 RepID=A0A194XUD6_MOLSC|nr:uncharacterized protein LY89DRAFT_7451 [Mollisia scopiformis]KUJ23930.1 hypothetical protein LY89DRAFT_7451 [Mollisia scopiformis]